MWDKLFSSFIVIFHLRRCTMADANFSLLTQKEWEVAKVGRCRLNLG